MDLAELAESDPFLTETILNSSRSNEAYYTPNRELSKTPLIDLIGRLHRMEARYGNMWIDH